MPHIEANGASLFYDQVGSGAPAIVLPGMFESGRSHARLALTLSSRFRVIMPDLRGYGRSRPPQRRFADDFYQRDAADMAALLTGLGLHDVRVVGAGDGAEVALLLAIRHPHLVRSIVAVDVSGAFAPGLLELLPHIANWEDPSANPEDMAHRNRVVREYGLETTLETWRQWKVAVRAILEHGGNISLAQAGAITSPVLILNGAADPLNTPAMSQELAATIPRAELRLVPDVRQLVYSPGRQSGFGDLVLEWLAAH
ncbi:MAG TPA: alpha/beta hydrolase [Chloroflexia bacterium]|nr:alpha/beta hydrolase [Chloroflexia bacterium]